MSIDLNLNIYPTAGQLERATSQRVRALYSQKYGHQPSKVDCHLLGNKVIISLEDVITPIEKLLVETASSSLVKQVRSFIDEAIKPQLQELVAETFQVNVIDCLYDTAIDTGCSGAIVILADVPQVRRPKSFYKKK